MRVKLFWKNDRGSLGELYKDGTFKPVSVGSVKEAWKDWWSGKNLPAWPHNGWREDRSLKKSQDLEDEINAWLSQNPNIRVVDVEQSASGGGLEPTLWLVSVWYEEAA